ncbi:MAG TPA: hypothetical protein VJ499_10075 [Flavisolibacter sp.]|nr:hypothetical protein [Flavisolibacter sp.]
MEFYPIKNSLLFSFLFFIIACNKKQVEFNTYQKAPKPVIAISHTVEGATLIQGSNVAEYVDSSFTDSTFYLYSSTLFNTIGLTFDVFVDKRSVVESSWTLEGDTMVRKGKTITVYFKQAVQNIKATCVVKWIPFNSNQMQTDTVTRMFSVLDEPKLFGKYRGVSSESEFPMEVTIGEIKEIDGSRDWGITNLFQGFPHQLPISLQSSGFGLDAAPFPYQQRYLINGNYYSQPFALGYLHGTKDSLTIRYAYVEYKDANSFDSMRVKYHVFKGVRQ